MLAVSRSTVVAAYDELRGSGLVTSRRGSGTAVVDAPAPGTLDRADGRVAGGGANALLQRLVDRPGEIISLAYAVEDGVPELADELAALTRTELPALLADSGYHPRGLPALNAAIAEHHTGAGLPTDPAQRSW